MEILGFFLQGFFLLPFWVVVVKLIEWTDELLR